MAKMDHDAVRRPAADFDCGWTVTSALALLSLRGARDLPMVEDEAPAAMQAAKARPVRSDV